MTDGWDISCEISLSKCHWTILMIRQHCSGNESVPSSNRPLPEPVLTKRRSEPGDYEKILVWNTGKLCESVIHDHDNDLCVTILGRMGVQDSDWGDCKRQGVVDTSSLYPCPMKLVEGILDLPCRSVCPSVDMVSIWPYAHLNGLVQERRNSSALAMELHEKTPLFEAKVANCLLLCTMFYAKSVLLSDYTSLVCETWMIKAESRC